LGRKLIYEISKVELGSVSPWKQLNPDLGIVLFIVIVLRNSLPNLGNRYSHNGIGSGVIIRGPIEDLDTKGPFAQALAPSFQCLFDNELQQSRIPSAVFKEVALNHSIELPSYLFSLYFIHQDCSGNWLHAGSLSNDCFQSITLCTQPDNRPRR